MALVLSLGSVNADFLTRVDQLPEGSGTTLAHGLLRTSGGKGANVAVLVRRLAGEAVLFGAVGDDNLADQALAGPQRAGVLLDDVTRVTGPTGSAFIAVAPDGDKSIVLALGANNAWADGAASTAARVGAAPEGSVLVVDFEAPDPCVRAAVDAAGQRGLAVLVDPAPPERVLEDVLHRADHLTPDHREAQALTGIDASTVDGAASAAATLARRTGATVHVKLASGGCAVSSEEGTWILDVPDVAVVDKTGAGDTFAGGLAWALLNGEGAPDLSMAAVAASTCAVTAYGSQESYPTAAELDEMRRRVTVRAVGAVDPST